MIPLLASGRPLPIKLNKFAVATEANSTDVGDLDTGVDTATCGASSSTYGYVVGGHNLYGVRKYSFTTDGNSVDSFDLTNTLLLFSNSIDNFVSCTWVLKPSGYISESVGKKMVST